MVGLLPRIAYICKDLPYEQLKTNNMYTVDYLKTPHADSFPRRWHSEIVLSQRPTGKVVCEYDDGFWD